MNLDDEENRKALEDWLADLRSLTFTYAGVSLPRGREEALRRLELYSELNRAMVDRAVSYYAARRLWPAVLNPEELFCIHLRVLNAIRVVGSILSGEVVREDIVALVLDDRVNFTEWMLTDGWQIFGPVYLGCYVDALERSGSGSR